MAFAATSRPVAFSVVAWFQNAVAELNSARARHASFNAAYNELNEMSEAELHEFGLNRSDLVDLAWRQVDAI
ncbi:MAG: DUF1127 domain-containing protein [Paracoccaceae bacterium]|jgi:uncharacterized protein YjiS (DUF1127 family)